MNERVSIRGTVRGHRIETEIPEDWPEGPSVRIELSVDEFDPPSDHEPSESRPESKKRRSASKSGRDEDYRQLQNHFAKNKVGELLGHLLIRDFDENSDDIRIIEQIVRLPGQVRGRRVRQGAKGEFGQLDDYRSSSDPRRPRLDQFGLERSGQEEEQ